MYSYEMLAKMKGQAVKDIWHSMIGKEAGIRNTTGLKTMEEVIQAILKAQEDPSIVKNLPQKAPKQVMVEREEEPMVRKKNPNPIIIPPSKKTIQAVESNEIPLTNIEIKRVVVKKLIIGDVEYFKDKETNEVFSVENGRPGQRVGVWNPTTRTIH